MFSRKAAAALLSITVLGASTTSPAHASSGKSVPLSQVEKLYDKAAEATAGWMSKNPFEVLTVNAYKGEKTSWYSIIRDREGRVKEAGSEQDTIVYVGSKAYVTMSERTLRPYEQQLATELGLNVKAKVLRAGAASLGVSYTNSRIDLPEEAKPEMIGSQYEIMMNNNPTCMVRSSGKQQVLKCTTKTKNPLVDETWVTVYAYTISSGRLVKEDVTTDGDIRTTMTYKPFNGRLITPKGPFLEYDTLVAHPNYGPAAIAFESQQMLDSFVREAEAYAAFNGNDRPGEAEWKEVAESQSLHLYDRGVGFRVMFRAEQPVEVCGVFTEEGARLEISSCDSLGFVKQ
jgi:hypothetical protein